MNVRACLRCGGLLAALLLSFGCSSKAKSPLDPVSGDTSAGIDASSHFRGFGVSGPRDITGARFFPLDSGSVWVYALEQRFVTIDTGGPPDTVTTGGSVTTLMRGPYDVDGTPYTLSTETRRTRGDRDFVQEVFYRQDATGLYELDAPIRDPLASTWSSAMHEALAARIARGRPAARRASLRALANLEDKVARVERLLHAATPVPATGPQGQPEIQRLSYPLSIGREWIVRADPLFTERVEARESVPVGSRRLVGWRIRIDSEFFGPDDRVWLWVSHEGELRFRYHLVSESTDESGNPIGLFIGEEDQQLVQYQIAGSSVVGSPVVPKLPFGGGTAPGATPWVASTR